MRPPVRRLSGNTAGGNNSAVGQNALLKNTTGKSNIGLGSNVGYNLTTGSGNIDIGNRGLAGESKTIRVGAQVGFCRPVCARAFVATQFALLRV